MKMRSWDLSRLLSPSLLTSIANQSQAWEITNIWQFSFLLLETLPNLPASGPIWLMLKAWKRSQFPIAYYNLYVNSVKRGITRNPLACYTFTNTPVFYANRAAGRRARCISVVFTRLASASAHGNVDSGHIIQRSVFCMNTQRRVSSSMHQCFPPNISEKLHSFHSTLDHVTWGEDMGKKPSDLLQFLL